MWWCVGLNGFRLACQLVVLALLLADALPRDDSLRRKFADLVMSDIANIFSIVSLPIFIVTSIMLLMPSDRRLYRVAKGLCPTCRYPRKGRVRRAPCPECGDSPSLRKRPTPNSA